MNNYVDLNEDSNKVDQYNCVTKKWVAVHDFDVPKVQNGIKLHTCNDCVYSSMLAVPIYAKAL